MGEDFSKTFKIRHISKTFSPVWLHGQDPRRLGKSDSSVLGLVVGLLVWTNNFFKSWRLKFEKKISETSCRVLYSPGQCCPVLVSAALCWKRPWDVLGSVPLSLGNVVARVTAEARLKKHQDFSKTWGRSIYGSLGKVFAHVTGA